MSRVLRGDSAERAQPVVWTQTGVEPAAGVLPFEPESAADALREISPLPPGGGNAEPHPRAARPPAAAPPAGAVASDIDLEAVRSQAFAAGLAEGQADGRRRAQEEHAAALESLESIVQELAGFKHRLRCEAETEVVELAFAVARRVLRREVTLDASTAVGIVRACIDQLAAQDVQRIRVHPTDRELVDQHVPDQVAVVADDGIEPGGAVLETSQGTLDARIDSQLEELRSGLADQ